MPLPRLSVRSADFCSIPFDQRPDGRVAVHRLEHVEAGTVQSNYRKVVIQRCEPPFVGTMLIGDQVGDVPGQEIQGLSCKMAWFVDSNSWLHVSRGALSTEAYTSCRFSCKNSTALWGLQMRRGGGAIRDDECPVHDGMDTANILILAGGQARVRVGIVGKYHARIKRAAFTVLKTPDVRDRMFCWCRIFPSDRSTGSHCGGFWNEIRRSIVDGDRSVGRCGRGRPCSPQHHDQHDEECLYRDGAFHTHDFSITILPCRSRRQVGLRGRSVRREQT